MSRTYSVRLVRPVFQSLTVEVQAWSRGSAVRKALRRAAGAAEGEWQTEDGPQADYSPHVESVLDHQQTYETSPNPHREIRAFRTRAKRWRYVLLAAEPAGAAGVLVTQPWFLRADAMLQADLCQDWIEPLGFVIENDGIDGGEGEGQQLGPPACGDNVIEFPVSEADEEFGGIGR